MKITQEILDDLTARAHALKRKFCYGDNDLVSFLVSVWGHLVKPGMV